MPTRTLVVWCRDWPVAALGLPVGEPVAVVRANRVVGTSASARVGGVVVGLGRREAQRRCPDLRIVERDEAREVRVFERIVAALEDITPRIEIMSPGCCGFPTRGPSRYFGGDEALAARVADLVGGLLAERDGCGVGVADGGFAATLAARRSLGRSGSPPIVVAGGRSGSFVAPFPVGTLSDPGPLPEDVVDVFRRLGLGRLGDLAQLPRADLLARFGCDGALAHQLANGDDGRPLLLSDPPEDLDQVAEIDPPAERVDQVTFVAKTLGDQLVDALNRRGAACTRLVVRIETVAPAGVSERCWRDDGALGAAAMAQRVRWQLDGWLSVSAGRVGAVRRVTLRPEGVIAASGRQQGFWGGRSAGEDRARRGAARVQALLGPDAVRVPDVGGGRGVINQARLVPIDAFGETPEHSVDAPWPGRVPRPHPASVWPDPVPAELLDARGASVAVSGRGVLSGPPAHISIDGGTWQRIVGWAGPWVVDERWWDPVGHRRRARLQVQVDSGAGHLVAIEAGSWWIDADYD